MCDPDYKRLFESSGGLYVAFDQDLRIVAASDAYLSATLARREELIGKTLAEVFAPQVQASEQRLRKVLDVEAIGVMFFDTTGTLIEANDTFLAWSGYTRNEVAARKLTWQTMTPPEWHEASGAQLERLAATGRIGPYEKEYLAKDGTRRWMLFVGAGLDDGTVVEYALDISERMRAEQALKDADRRKDEFLATLAHELRNPLAPIRSALDLLRLMEAPAPELCMAREVIGRQVDHLVRLVDDLLDVSRITFGKVQLRREPIDLRTVVEDALGTSKPLLQEAGHRVSVRLPAASLPVDGDPMRLAQVVSNLLNNAARYTPHAGEIALEAGRQGDQAFISVQDNGAGIPREMLPRVFEPFMQLGQPGATLSPGIGIGLALAKRLAELHGGSVRAESEGLGKGSRFEVRLPLDAAALRRRVLLVDDNVDAAAAQAALLRMHGHEVETAHSGEEALERASRFCPEVVLLDLGMPGMDGFEVARRLRQTPEGRGAVLIAQSGWEEEEDRKRTAAAGFDAHLAKPVELRALMEKLSHANVKN